MRWGRARSAVAGALALGWMSACTGLGDDVPIEDLGATNGNLGAPGTVPGRDFEEQIDPGFEGHWVGYVENPFARDADGQPLAAVFPSGSTEVTLDYRFDGEYRTPSATLTFGAGPAPVPENGVAYPPGVHHYFYLIGRRGVDDSFQAPVVEGFEYALTEISPRYAGYDPGPGSLLSFRELAAFEEWCAVQQPPMPPDRNFECVGSGTGFAGGAPAGTEGGPCVVQRNDGTEEAVDCDLAAMCMSDLCSCNTDGCVFAGSQQLAPVSLEHHDDQIVGTISGATLDSGYPGWYNPMGTLRLFRAD